MVLDQSKLTMIDLGHNYSQLIMINQLNQNVYIHISFLILEHRTELRESTLLYNRCLLYDALNHPLTLTSGCGFVFLPRNQSTQWNQSCELKTRGHLLFFPALIKTKLFQK